MSLNDTATQRPATINSLDQRRRVKLTRETAPGKGESRTQEPAVDQLLDALDEGIICCDADGVVLAANQAAHVLQGLRPEGPLVGLRFTGASALRTTSAEPLPPADHPLLQVLREGSARSAHLILSGSGQNGARHLTISAKPAPAGEGGGAIAVIRDVTAEWKEREQLAQYALHDPLTGLANRHLLLEELQRMLRGLDRRGGSVSLVFLDLDDFKAINDDHGHLVGDEILKAVSCRLQAAVRGDDVVTRLGGDEFVVVHASASADADIVAARLRAVLAAPFLVANDVLAISASLGWASTNNPQITPQQLLDQADEAMYSDKRLRSGKATDR